MSGFLLLIASILLIWGIAFFRIPLLAWSVGIGALLIGLTYFGWFGKGMWAFVLFYILVLLPLNIPYLRRILLTKKIFNWFCKALPLMSQTEKEALDAGDTWWEKELFQGKPNWQLLNEMPKPSLTQEEQAFLDNQVEVLCEMTNDWEITQDNDLPIKIWDYLKKEKFFGMIIPKKYGGLAFSAFAHSAIITKLATRSISVAVTTMVPNSLGPAELLLEYGTQEQKDYFLSKLANGSEIPCFALTAPQSGSDAGSISDKGIICKGSHNSQEMIGIRLTFDKRYITLAPVATLIGLAFKLFDPDNLLSNKKNLGITLCLLPRNHPGIEIGARHSPMNLAFMNGPIRGKDIFIPLDWIIGGISMAGQGWRMLMECLSQGRGISLPALSTATGMLACRMTSAYACIRRQFNLPIAAFEGVEESLTRIITQTYQLESSRLFTLIPIQNHLRPAVATAIAKYHTTEIARKVINDAMDIHGGRGIMMGPLNYLGRAYQGIPISITVEGANILTRSLIIFGQGAIRCHPYVKEEMKAANMNQENQKEALKYFDKYFIKHVGFFLSNIARCLVLSFSRGIVAVVPTKDSSKKYLKKISWLSSSLSVCSDISLILLGGDLKRKEKISARLGDALSYLYLASAALKYYNDNGKSNEDWFVLEWILQSNLYQTQEAFYGFFENFPQHTIISKILKWFIFPYGKAFTQPKDTLAHKITKEFLAPSNLRDRITSLCYIGKESGDPTGLIESTFSHLLASKDSLDKVAHAIKDKKIKKGLSFCDQIENAFNQKIINESEFEKLKLLEALRLKSISVDEFTDPSHLGS